MCLGSTHIASLVIILGTS